MPSWTQRFRTNPGQLSVAPAGLGPVGYDEPVLAPTGIQQTKPGPERGQYKQNVDNSQWVGAPSLVPGLRGKAHSTPAWMDPMSQTALGPWNETNGGYPYHYGVQRIRSWKPSMPVVVIGVSKQEAKPYRFKAVPLQEFSVGNCT